MEKLDFKEIIEENGIFTIIKSIRFFIFDSFEEDLQNGILTEIDNQIDSQKTLKNGEIIFDINSNGGDTSVLHNILQFKI